MFFVMLVFGALSAARPGRASTMCTSRHDILGARGHHVFLWTRAGGECGGFAILDVTMDPDSAGVRRAFDGGNSVKELVCPYDDWFGRDFMHYGGDYPLVEGLASRIELPTLGIAITAPPAVPDTGWSEVPARPPIVDGVRTRLIFASAPYIQQTYLLRSAYVDTITKTMLVITHSERGIRENYSTPTLGDGIMILALERDGSR